MIGRKVESFIVRCVQLWTGFEIDKTGVYPKPGRILGVEFWFVRLGLAKDGLRWKVRLESRVMKDAPSG